MPFNIHLPSEMNGIVRHGWFYLSKRGRLKRLNEREQRRVLYDGSLQRVKKLYFGIDFYGPVAEAAKWKTNAWQMTAVCSFEAICWSKSMGRHEAAAKLRLTQASEEVSSGKYRGWCMLQLDAATLRALLGNMMKVQAPTTTLSCGSVSLEFALQSSWKHAKDVSTKTFALSQKAFVRRK